MKKVVLWILVSFIMMSVLGSLLSGDILAGAALLVLAALLAPIQAWQTFLTSHIKKWLRITLIVVCCVLFTFGIGSSDSQTEPVVPNNDSIVGTSTSTTTTSTRAVTTTTSMTTSSTQATTTTVTTTKTTTATTTNSTTAPTTVTTTVETTTILTTTTTAQIESETITYILNTNPSSRKFHKPSCRHVKTIHDENRQEFSGSRDDVLNLGYEPCGTCNP